MRIFILLLMAAAFVRAEPATLAEKYTHWKYAAEIQVRNPESRQRLREVVDVGLRLPVHRTANLSNDARVVLKRAFDELAEEIPFQIYAIATRGDYTTCRVAFYADLPPNGFQRFAVFYDNPEAVHPVFPRRVTLESASGKLTVETPFYAAAFDEDSGQCVALQSKIAPGGTVYARPADGRAGSAFPLPGIAVPALATEANRPLALRLAKAGDDGDRRLDGPVFAAVTGRRHFLAAGGEAPAAVDFTYLFYAEAPHFVVRTSVSFLRETDVYSIEANTLGADQRRLTHFLFRPVTPTFPLTEIEEIGSIMVDPASRAGYPDGDLLAGMLPADLAWQAVADIDGGFAVTGFQLFRHDSSPDGHVPYYRASTRARLRQGWVEWSEAPIYVTAQDRLSEAVRVPRGAVYEAAEAVAFSNFRQGDWRAATDDYGRQLNTRMEIKVYPRGTGLADGEADFPHYGERADAYLRGIR